MSPVTSALSHTLGITTLIFFLMQWLRVKKKCHGQASVCLYWVSQQRLKVSAFKRWDVTPWLQRAPCCWQVAHQLALWKLQVQIAFSNTWVPDCILAACCSIRSLTALLPHWVLGEGEKKSSNPKTSGDDFCCTRKVIRKLLPLQRIERKCEIKLSLGHTVR